MPIDDPELGLLLDEIKTIKRFGKDGLDMPWERVEMYNLILDIMENKDG